jgi:hypothetical protein
VGDLTSLRAIPHNNGWLLAAVSACGGNPDACSMFWVALALLLTRLRTIPLMLGLAKDTPASMVFRGDILVWLGTSYLLPLFPLIAD